MKTGTIEMQNVIQEVQRQLKAYNRIPSQSILTEGQPPALLIYGPTNLKVLFYDGQVLGEEQYSHEVLLQLPKQATPDEIANKIATISHQIPELLQTRFNLIWDAGQKASPIQHKS
jgi:hypothetical protein